MKYKDASVGIPGTYVVETFRDILKALQVNILFNGRLLGSELLNAALHIEFQWNIGCRQKAAKAQLTALIEGS
jgi:hypothetical protein